VTDSGRMSCAHCGFSFNVLAMTMALSTVPGGGTLFNSVRASGTAGQDIQQEGRRTAWDLRIRAGFARVN